MRGHSHDVEEDRALRPKTDRIGARHRSNRGAGSVDADEARALEQVAELQRLLAWRTG